MCYQSSRDAVAECCKMAGSQAALGKVLGVSQTSVWRWLKGYSPFPAEYVLATERLYGVSRHDLRPDIYPIEESRTAVGA